MVLISDKEFSSEMDWYSPAISPVAVVSNVLQKYSLKTNYYSAHLSRGRWKFSQFPATFRLLSNECRCRQSHFKRGLIVVAYVC